MKKIIIKILFIIILLAIPFVFIKTNVYAVIDPTTYTPEGNIDHELVEKYGGKLYSTLRLIGIYLAVLALMILGLKYILSSVTEKADYKKNLVPIAIGIFMMAAILEIVSIFGSIGEQLNSSKDATIEKIAYYCEQKSDINL